jgi:hypothetical protein
MKLTCCALTPDPTRSPSSTPNASDGPSPSRNLHKLRLDAPVDRRKNSAVKTQTWLICEQLGKAERR